MTMLEYEQRINSRELQPMTDGRDAEFPPGVCLQLGDSLEGRYDNQSA